MGAEASRENILKFLAEFSSRMERRSIVVIYFSGHGYEFVEFDPQKSGEKHFDQGIVPADQNETEVAQLVYLPFLEMFFFSSVILC